ncbi:TolC family outer membrane protein [Sphingomonas sanguinis]|uniref:TolC family outer membrane protein n=1 Tax=Sphingomonas sanguinis TaxID=33051 RepID=UPI0009E791EB|nr:TolC family outer membrane protein [Sphingomonas sanguinis]
MKAGIIQMKIRSGGDFSPVRNGNSVTYLAAKVNFRHRVATRSMIRQKFGKSILITLCVSSAAHSQRLVVVPPQPAEVSTLTAAIAEAYRSNPSLGVSRYDLKALYEGYAQARAEQRLNIQTQLVGSNVPQQIGTDPRSNTYGALIVDQPIYSGGKTTADIASASASAKAGEASLRATEGDVLLGVITAYTDVRRDQRSLDIRRDDLVVLNSLLREIAARRQAGELTATDVAQAEAQVRTAEAQVASAQAQLEASRATFAMLVGLAPGHLTPEPPLPNVPGTIDVALRSAGIDNPDIAAAKATADSSAQRINAARAGGMPTMSFRSIFGVNGSISPLFLRTDIPRFTNQLSVSVPFTMGGRIRSSIRQAEDQNAADRLRIEQAQRVTMQGVFQSWNADVAARRAGQVQVAQLQAAKTLLDGSLQEYRVGLRTTFDVLYAEQTLRDTLLAIASSDCDAYVAEATLLRKVGALNVADLTMTAPSFNPIAEARAAERRDRLPWDGVFALLDRVGSDSFHPKPLANYPVAITQLKASSGPGPRDFASVSVPANAVSPSAEIQ